MDDDAAFQCVSDTTVKCERRATKKVAAAAAFDNSEEGDLPLFASVSNAKTVQPWDRNKVVNRSRLGVLGLEEQVNRNVEEKLRKAGEIGDRFKDHGSQKILEEAFDESKQILNAIAKHDTARRDRLEAAKKESWQRPWEIEQNLHLRRRQARQKEQIDTQLLEIGKWSQR